MEDVIRYYSRKDVQRAIVEISKNREVGVKFSDKGYGKRPDVINFDNDVYELAKKGATSFHISEELWKDPLLIRTGMTKKQLDALRIGWDLLIDLDGIDLEYSKLAGYYLIEALKFYDIKNISAKFSGNKGMHIGISFETFPKKINNVEIKDFFPEGPRIIAGYLKTMINDHLSNAVLKKETINEISEKLNKPKEKLMKNNKLDPFNLVDIDTILISSRHLFRAPYSINEKSGLVSIPIKHSEILNFNKEKAKIENVEVNIKFLDKSNIEKQESSELFDKALYWNLKNKKQEEVKSLNKKTYDLPKTKINEVFFPPCIKFILSGIKSDGRKRALFILLNFFKSLNYDEEQIKSIIIDWNKKNNEPLRENYVVSQLTWHKRQDKSILPPNCPERKDNIPIIQQNYYTDLGFCHPDDFCKLIKNPINYAIRKQSVFGKKF